MTRLQQFAERLVDEITDRYDHGDSTSEGRCRAVAERLIREFVGRVIDRGELLDDLDAPASPEDR